MSPPHRLPLLIALLALAGLPGPAPAQQDGLPDWLVPPGGLPPPPADPKAAARAEAEAMAQPMESKVEEMLGARPDELKDMSKLELMMRLGANAMTRGEPEEARDTPRARPVKPHPPLDPLSLAPEPPGGFADGAHPLPTDRSGATLLTATDPPGPAILVVVDPVERRILLREDVTLPLRRDLSLRSLSPRFDTLVVELLDPPTRHVLLRFRPVSAAPDPE